MKIIKCERIEQEKLEILFDGKKRPYLFRRDSDGRWFDEGYQSYLAEEDTIDLEKGYQEYKNENNKV